MKNLLAPELVLIFGASLWGLGWLPLHYFATLGLVGMPMVLACYGLLTLVALPVLWRQRRAWLGQRWRLLAMASFGGWGTAALVAALSITDDVIRVMLLFYLAPVWGLLGSRLVLNEPLTPLRLLSLALAMIGIVLTLGVSRETFSLFTTADWLGLTAGLGFALNNLATRAATAVPLASKTVAAFVGCAIVATISCLLQSDGLPAMSIGIWLQVALFSVGWLIAMLAAQYGVTHLEAGRSAVLMIFELLSAVFSAALLSDQPVAAHVWLGGALVTVAAVIAGWPSRSESVLETGNQRFVP